MEIRTSISHPLQINVLDFSKYTKYSGKIGMTFCAGKKQFSAYSNVLWDRDLTTDVSVIKQWGADIWLNLMEDKDLVSVKLDPENFSRTIKTAGIEYLHYPIVDGSVPDERESLLWDNERIPALLSRINNGCKILIHCRGGLGRTGLIAARLLIAAGIKPVEAIAIVRDVRTGTIENDLQEKWLINRDIFDN